MTMKLTEVQRRLLDEICEHPRYVADYYRPAIKLVELGLCQWRGTKLHPTEKGKAANAEEDKSDVE
jgi:hypothetical protein